MNTQNLNQVQDLLDHVTQNSAIFQALAKKDNYISLLTKEAKNDEGKIYSWTQLVLTQNGLSTKRWFATIEDDNTYEQSISTQSACEDFGQKEIIDNIKKLLIDCRDNLFKEKQLIQQRLSQIETLDQQIKHLVFCHN